MRPYAATPRLLAAIVMALGLAFYPALTPGSGAKTVAFVFSDLDGRPVRLADYRGQWLLVAFWAPWCPLCKIQMPTLKALDGRVRKLGLLYPDVLDLAPARPDCLPCRPRSR